LRKTVEGILNTLVQLAANISMANETNDEICVVHRAHCMYCGRTNPCWNLPWRVQTASVLECTSSLLVFAQQQPVYTHKHI